LSLTVLILAPILGFIMTIATMVFNLLIFDACGMES
jgi:hypothetical protein